MNGESGVSLLSGETVGILIKYLHQSAFAAIGQIDLLAGLAVSSEQEAWASPLLAPQAPRSVLLALLPAPAEKMFWRALGIALLTKRTFESFSH